jgi:hypothetical protein
VAALGVVQKQPMPPCEQQLTAAHRPRVCRLVCGHHYQNEANLKMKKTILVSKLVKERNNYLKNIPRAQTTLVLSFGPPTLCVFGCVVIFAGTAWLVLVL